MELFEREGISLKTLKERVVDYWTNKAYMAHISPFDKNLSKTLLKMMKNTVVDRFYDHIFMEDIDLTRWKEFALTQKFDKEKAQYRDFILSVSLRELGMKVFLEDIITAYTNTDKFKESIQIKGYQILGEMDDDRFIQPEEYEVGKIYEINAMPNHKRQIGFRFETDLSHLFVWHSSYLNPNTKVIEILSLGAVDYDNCAWYTNKLKILREISYEEIFELGNIGYGCTGLQNTGNYNEGWGNTGAYNTGDCNTGDDNSGYKNTGKNNKGDYNTGDHNIGNCNVGSYNKSDNNVGWYNSGKGNIGSYNEGCYNTGKWNKGYGNTGNFNLGNHNTGDFNLCDFSSGCLNTETPKIYLFNKPSPWTHQEWRNSKAYALLENIMTKDLNNPKKRQKRWDRYCLKTKEVIWNIPNFDADIFEEITGIDARPKVIK